MTHLSMHMVKNWCPWNSTGWGKWQKNYIPFTTVLASCIFPALSRVFGWWLHLFGRTEYGWLAPGYPGLRKLPRHSFQAFFWVSSGMYSYGQVLQFTLQVKSRYNNSGYKIDLTKQKSAGPCPSRFYLCTKLLVHETIRQKIILDATLFLIPCRYCSAK